jgi:endonuclease/exonuclease/phosphatase family metal-dependent hydrolase
MLRSAIRAVLIGQVLAAGCRSGLNYPNPLGPRYAGAVSPVPAAPPHPDPAVIRVVTFNIAYGRHIERAIELLQAPLPQPLRSADIISLQEMDAASTARIAGVLGMSYVYYPAIVHPKTGRDFGNAILSRWPIVADAKIVLPHLARFRHTERIATAATILIGDVAVRV